jgi:hypothetical protein
MPLQQVVPVEDPIAFRTLDCAVGICSREPFATSVGRSKQTVQLMALQMLRSPEALITGRIVTVVTNTFRHFTSVERY